MSDEQSCLVARLSNHIEIDDDLEHMIAKLEKSERGFKSGTHIHSSGDNTDHLYVVKKGWFLSYTGLHDGSRLVVKIHLPGDIIGFSGIAFKSHVMNLKSCTDGILCPFGKSDLDEIFVNGPRLTALLFTLAVREQVVFIDRLRAVSRMSAELRISHLLLELLHRLRMTNMSMTNEFRLPLTQHEIGDAVGLTNVSVSRTIKRMEAEQLVCRTDTHITLLDEAKLKERCDFSDRYSDVDISWFPQRK